MSPSLEDGVVYLSILEPFESAEFVRCISIAMSAVSSCVCILRCLFKSMEERDHAVAFLLGLLSTYVKAGRIDVRMHHHWHHNGLQSPYCIGVCKVR